MPGEPIVVPDADTDSSAGRGSSSDVPPRRRTGTHGAAIEDLADPDADANIPNPSRPVAMAVGSQPAGCRNVPGGGYGDSRYAENRDTPAVYDEKTGEDPVMNDEICSGSHVAEDDTKGRPPGSCVPVEHPSVSQPINVTQPRRP
jgi:hypothetical protein